MYKIIEEGKARIYVSVEKKISKELPVFYNPVMKLNRDLNVLVLNAIDNTDMQIASPLAASGVREIRLLLELKKGKIKEVFLNDYSLEAVNLIKKNLILNKVKAKASYKDANQFMLESKGFDYIDIDPFGSPNPFLDSSIVRLSRGGLLGVTATDTSGLAGTYPDVTHRNYWSHPLKNEFMHETGIRILIRKIQLIGSQHEKALIPVFSLSKDHYYRVYMSCEKGKTKVDDILKQQGYLQYCRKCLFRKTTSIIINNICENCGNVIDYAGPLWLGKIWDTKLVETMINGNKVEPLNKLLSTIYDESKIDSVGFFTLSELARANKTNPPKITDLMSKIKALGFKVSRTHFDGEGMRSDIDAKNIFKLF